MIVGEIDPSKVAVSLRDAFGDRIYGMITRHRREDEVVQEARLRERANRYGVPLVAANEIIYHTPARRQLLIRSPRAPATSATPERTTNVDLVCLGVEYMALPRLFRGLEVLPPTRNELEQLRSLLGRLLDFGNVRMLVSEGQRFPVVASSFELSENDWDIFESPFEFRSHFRGK